CDFMRLDGYLFLGGDDTIELLERELAALHRVGMNDTTLVMDTPITSFVSGPAIRYPLQAQFHPLKFLAGLCACIERDGGMIYTGSHVNEIKAGAPVNIGTEDKIS